MNWYVMKEWTLKKLKWNCRQIVNPLNLEKGIRKKGITKLNQGIQFETIERGGRGRIKIFPNYNVYEGIRN